MQQQSIARVPVIIIVTVGGHTIVLVHTVYINTAGYVLLTVFLIHGCTGERV